MIIGYVLLAVGVLGVPLSMWRWAVARTRIGMTLWTCLMLICGTLILSTLFGGPL